MKFYWLPWERAWSIFCRVTCCAFHPWQNQLGAHCKGAKAMSDTDNDRRQFLKTFMSAGAVVMTLGSSALAAGEGVKVGKLAMTIAAAARGECSYGSDCAGGGGQCSTGSTCAGGGGQCSTGSTCAGGGGQCSTGSTCAGGGGQCSTGSTCAGGGGQCSTGSTCAGGGGKCSTGSSCGGS